MIEDVSWERMAQLIVAQRELAQRELVYPTFSHNGNEKFHNQFQVTAIRLNGRYKRPKCARCGNLVARKPSNLKFWRKRGLLCRKCFQQKNKAKT